MIASASSVISANPFGIAAVDHTPKVEENKKTAVYGVGESGDLSRFAGAKAISSDMLFNENREGDGYGGGVQQ